MAVVDTRRKKIVDLLKKNDSMSVQSIIDSFEYSPATIRNDLKSLSKKGVIIRQHGSASINHSFFNMYTENFSDRELKYHDQKTKIAHEAIKYIKDSQCIILDASSTCYELAKIIDQSNMKLTVITNGLMVAELLKSNPAITLILIGGILNGTSSALEGLLGIELLTKLNIDCAFVSPNAFTVEKGLTDFSIYEVQLKQEIIKYSNKNIALISQDKLGHTSLAQFATTAQIDKFIISSADQDSKIIDNNLLKKNVHLNYVIVWISNTFTLNI